MEPAEFVSELATQGVVVARNITQKRDGVLRKTPSIVLTFACAVLPTRVQAGYLSLKVTPFTPSPLRCFNCQGFGHHQASCRKPKICPKCGETAQGEGPCAHPTRCTN